MNAARQSQKNAMIAARKSRKNAKFLFWSLIFLVMLVTQIILEIALLFVFHLLHRWFGVWYKIDGGCAAGMLILDYVIAFISVAAIGRRYGFVEPRRTETLRRIPGQMPASVETLELRTPESTRKQLMWACPFAGCLIVALALLADTNSTRIYAFAAAGLLLAFGLFLFWRSKTEEFDLVARIDREGVVAYQGFRRRSAAWQEIDSVEILTLSGAPGAPVTRTYAVIGRNAKRLFFFNLLFVRPAEQENFERALRKAFEAQATMPEMII